MLQLHLADME